MAEKPNALTSMWGEDNANAIAKKRELVRTIRARECVAMPGIREQTICTPDEILDPLRAIWRGIDMDPCAAPGRSIGAAQEIRLPQDGLRVRWPDRTFVNPPYGELSRWLEPRADWQDRWCWLVPVRSQRKWWREWARSLGTLIYLNPVKFVGYKQAFPAPLCLGFTETNAAWAFGHLGETL